MRRAYTKLSKLWMCLTIIWDLRGQIDLFGNISEGIWYRQGAMGISIYDRSYPSN